MRASSAIALVCSVGPVLVGCASRSNQPLPIGFLQSRTAATSTFELPRASGLRITEMGTNLYLQACSAIGVDGNPWVPAATSNTYSATGGTATVSTGAIQFHAGPSDGGGFICPITTAPTGVYVFRQYTSESYQLSDTLSVVSSAGATTVSPANLWIRGPTGNDISAAYDPSTGLAWAGVYNGNVSATALLAGNESGVTVSHPFRAPWPIGPVAVSNDAIYAFVRPSSALIDRFSKTGRLLGSLPPPRGFFPTAMVEGADHNIWFTDVGNNAVGYFTGAGRFTEYSIPSANAMPDSIALSAGNNVWFTEPNADKIGRVTASGHIAEYSLPAGGQFGEAISSSGPKARTLWFLVFDGPGRFNNGFGEISLGPAICDLATGK
jgi:hypothetical protein